MGVIQLQFDYDWAAAESSLRRALQIAPGHALTSSTYANLLRLRGRLDEAFAVLAAALERDPLSFHLHLSQAAVFRALGRYEQAITAYQRARALGDDPMIGADLGTTYCEQGRHAEGIRELEVAWRRARDNALTAARLADCLASVGRTDDARSLLRELETELPYLSSAAVGRIQLALGEHAAALDALEQGIQRRDLGVLSLALDRRWAPLRDDPRFRAARSQLGLS